MSQEYQVTALVVGLVELNKGSKGHGLPQQVHLVKWHVCLHCKSGFQWPKGAQGWTVWTSGWHGPTLAGFRTNASWWAWGYALRRFLKGQVCVSVDKQEEEICGRRNSMGKDGEERAAPGRARSWKELNGEMAGGYRWKRRLHNSVNGTSWLCATEF